MGCLGPSGDDPSRKIYGTPRRGHSIPRDGDAVAMLTLLRVPLLPVSERQSVPRPATSGGAMLTLLRLPFLI
jgi:hypothetical protein